MAIPKTQAPTERRTVRRFEARLLGGLTLRCDGLPLVESAFRRRKSLLLLLRLLVEPTHRLPVDTILELLWPEQDPELSAVNLRAVLGGIRLALPDRAVRNPVVRIDASLAIDPLLDLVLDVERFDVAAQAGLSNDDPASLQRALALYGGPLLPSLPYEEWVSARGEALARLHRQVVLTLTTQGETGTEEQLHALLVEDPTDEEVGRALMRRLGGQGRKAEALRIEHILTTALREELGVSPSPETAALHAALLDSPVPPAGSPAEAQVLSSPETSRHNLPAALSSFVGRVWEQTELRHLLDRTRLLTLTGPGGCGKTRLALTLGEEQAALKSGEVRLVELASVSVGTEVIRATARVFGVREESDRVLLDTLAAYIAERRVLIVLDNCEQVLESCAALAYALLRACSGLRILVTSRERLGLIGETVRLVPPLSLPTPSGASIAQLAQAEAIQLFIERVRGVRPNFALSNRNAAITARICRRLDGLPLAIELAAARAATLSIEQIAERLDDRFRLLTSGNRGALPRHQTLRAAVDWSWELLEEKEQAFLRRLAVFVGGWTLRPAEVVCAEKAYSALHDRDVLPADLLDGLVAKSLVQVTDSDGKEARYGLLETMRQYAAERLAAAGEQDTARDRHLDWCVALAEEGTNHLQGPEQGAWLIRLEREHDNLRAALEWAHAQTKTTLELRLAGALWRFWLIRGYLSEGRGWLKQATAGDGDVPAAVRAPALTGAGVLAAQQGDYGTAAARFEEALLLRRALGDARLIAGSLENLAVLAKLRRDYEQAGMLHEEALALYRDLDYQPGIADALSGLGTLAFRQGDLTRAAAFHEKALIPYRLLRNTLGTARTLGNLGNVAHHQREYARATVLHQEALDLQRTLGDKTGIAHSLHNLGLAAYEQGDYDRTTTHLAGALPLLSELSDHALLAEGLELAAYTAAAQGRTRQAAVTAGAAEALRQTLAVARPAEEWTDQEQVVHKLREALGEETFAVAWAEGRTLSLEQVIAGVLSP